VLFADHRGVVMHNFIKNFLREGAGVWVCLQAATQDFPQGRVQVSAGTRLTIGSKFMNVDLARLLDEEYSRINGPRHPG
jgi:hypothetical protein